MKLYKLIAHQKNFSDEDLVLSSKDFPHVKLRDIVEIYHPEDEGTRLLLQVTFLKEEMQTKDTISVEQSIASMFQLRVFSDVCVSVVSPETVALDSIEVTFKEQYLGRSDMWRLKKSLVGTCVYTNKKIEFCHKSVRCQVYEMWSRGDKVACGVVTNDTKIVFRSSTSQVYLFLQMSSEMWEFDIYGDLYFEKAVNGFLAELFAKWKKQGCNHEVTIVLFSRVFYEIDSVENLPEYFTACLQRDYRGKIYEDFYRVAVQSERFDDWAEVLPQLRKLFNQWQTTVLGYHHQPGVNIPRAVNSNAAQGNFLEVLNMSLNVFEKHYLDRSFDRTGQLSVVITPGVGVFEVDRELTNITKQRIIDNGVGSDLVCVGEQPLHAVPLLKFHNKESSLNTGNDFSMPHWINLSFYTSNKRVGYSTFIPRIKVGPIVPKQTPKWQPRGLPPTKVYEDTGLPNSVFDYDAYDAQVFTLPSSRTSKVQTLQRDGQRKNNVAPDAAASLKRIKHKRSSRVSETESGVAMDTLSSSLASTTLKSPSVAIPKRAIDDCYSASVGGAALAGRMRRLSGGDEKSDDALGRVVVGSAGSPYGHRLLGNHPAEQSQKYYPAKKGRALINPFDPSHVTIKLTSNRRRWTHIFPKGPTGVLIQQHHYQAVPTSSGSEDLLGSGYFPVEMSSVDEQRQAVVSGPLNPREKPKPLNRSLTLLWGATGEQEWTPALTTGVDWKSLTIPACLPITTDYFPDQRSLHNDYVVSNYLLIPDDVNAEYVQQRASGRRQLETKEVFLELVNQRLAQGFQLILLPKQPAPAPDATEYVLSIGRIFHRISLKGSTITVTGYKPRHPYPVLEYHYRYRLQAPDQDTYEVSWVDFNAEKLENFNWNRLDHYVCTRGDPEFALTESFKYWRLRLCILPIAATKSDEVHTEAVMKFIELCVNRLKRPVPVRKAKPFRERGGSNRVTERPRLRSMAADIKINAQVASNQESGSLDSRATEEPDFPRPRVPANPQQVAEAMKSPPNGLSFITKPGILPSNAFISSDAVAWVVEHVESITSEAEAIRLLRTLLAEKLIVHASGNPRQDFVHGFYLYYLPSAEKIPKDEFNPSGDLDSFRYEWAEIQLGDNQSRVNIAEAVTEEDGERFSELQRLYEERYHQVLRCYRPCSLETDINNKSDRLEWGHLRYQSCFFPDASLEFIFQWMVCTGTIVSELVSHWSRKATNCGLSLVPMPCDPFALPNSHKADPLRAPLYIPLNLESLGHDGKSFLHRCDPKTWPLRLVFFQECIVRQFGFLPCCPDPASPAFSSFLSSSFIGHGKKKDTPPRQFIHQSGCMFVMIIDQSLCGNEEASVGPMKKPNNYITRHVVGKNKWQRHRQARVGFLWAWNSILGRRCRNATTMEDTSPTKLLVDFRNFCANAENKLKNFWLQVSTQPKAPYA